MKILKIKDIINSMYEGMLTDEEIYGHPSMKRQIYESEQRKLNEGLILSHPLQSTISVLEKMDFEIVLIDDDKFRNRFIVELDGESDMSKLFKILVNVGWYASSVRSSNIKNPKMQKYTQSNLNGFIQREGKVWVVIEPKYDIEVDIREYKRLYHFTHKVYLDKIMEVGLTPKTQAKISTHPERVYLAFTEHAATKFGNKEINRTSKIPKKSNGKFDRPERDLVGVILSIKVDSLPDFLKVYKDPNYYEEGCFTLNSIPPTALKVVKEINLNY